MDYLLVIAGAYLLGCSNMALYISKWKKVDFRAGGSGNLGASNAAALMGCNAGITVALQDIGKSVLAVLIAKILFPALPYVGAVAGVACVLGHIFPFYLKFKGGKGTASFWGMTLALNWKLALLVGLILILATIITDYMVIGTFSAIAVVPAYMGFFLHNLILMAIVAVASFTIFW